MADQVSLLAYLQQGLPMIPAYPPPNPGSNTTNDAYNFEDVHVLAVWQAFNVNTILQHYQNFLTATFLPADPMSVSPPNGITSKNALRHRIAEIVTPRIRRALRVTFANQLNGLTPVSFGCGEYAQTILDFIPDTSYFVLGIPVGTGLNRAPGDVRPNWKWSSALRTGTPSQQREYRQVLSQVNWYMKQHTARYGFILTDHELVAIRRLDYNGNLQVSNPIPWESRGTVAQPRLTVLLALWYLGMLASQDEGPDRWTM